MSNKIIHTCASDEDGKHIKGLCCIIEDLQKENARLRESLEKITDLHADDGHDMLYIAYKALKQGKEE
jgi:hypothetical protein